MDAFLYDIGKRLILATGGQTQAEYDALADRLHLLREFPAGVDL